MKDQKLLFVSSAIQQPRHQRRIRILHQEFDVRLLYYKRSMYANNIQIPDCEARCLGAIYDTRFSTLSRLFHLVKLFIVLLIRTERLIYTTSPDQAFVGILAGKDVFVEYGDIQALSRGSGIYQCLDRWIISKARGIVVTSPYYIDGYFAKFGSYRKDKFYVLENKVPLQTGMEYRHAPLQKRSSSEFIRVGLIGALGRPNIYNLLKKVLDENPNFIIEVFGDGNLGDLQNHHRCHMHGAFKNPDDLLKIYNTIDVNLILYENSDMNVQLALPNKLYESILFQKPIVCTSRTSLEQVVCELRIGFATSLSVDDIGQTIHRVAVTDWSHSWKNIAFERFVSDNEQVINWIKQRV